LINAKNLKKRRIATLILGRKNFMTTVSRKTKWTAFAAITCLAGAAWYQNEESKHKTLLIEKHKRQKLEWLQSANPLELDNTITTHFNAKEKNFTIPLHSLSDPISQKPLQFINSSTELISKLEGKLLFYRESIEIDLNLQDIWLQDATAYAVSYYDLYPGKRLQISSTSSNKWEQALHVIKVENYWFPASNFTLFLIYQIKLTTMGDVKIRAIQLHTVAEKLTTRLVSTITIQNQKNLVTTRFSLETTDNQLSIRVFRVSNTRFVALYEFQNNMLIQPIVQPLEYFFTGFYLYPVDNIDKFLFIQVQFLETGVIDLKEQVTISIDKSGGPMFVGATGDYRIEAWVVSLNTENNGVVSKIIHFNRCYFLCFATPMLKVLRFVQNVDGNLFRVQLNTKTSHCKLVAI
jgi:hypothetical protein